jgi:hypothetical protein
MLTNSLRFGFLRGAFGFAETEKIRGLLFRDIGSLPVKLLSIRPLGERRNPQNQSLSKVFDLILTGETEPIGPK